jgi:membrane-associated phospholipid phosphatase
MKKLLPAVLIMLIFQAPLYSDSTFSLKKKSPKKTTVWQDLGTDLKYFAVDWGSYLTLPFRMDYGDFMIGSSVIAGTVISSTTDKAFREATARYGYETYNGDFWDIPTAYGFVQYPSIFGGALYAVGLFARETEIRKTGRMLIQALAYSGTLTMGMRYLFGRERPFTSRDGSQYNFTWFQSEGDTQSFPSGHMVVAAATSTVLAEQIDTWWARVVLYSFAALTGYARLYNDKHWLSDVLFGAALGYGTGIFVINQERRREDEQKKKLKKKGGGFSIQPTFNGIHLSYGF